MSNEVQAKILIAEDNPIGMELMEAYLSDEPFEIKGAINGEEAWKAVQEWKPDVVLLDVMMPKISGFEVCKRLRANPQTRNTGVLMVTALDQHSDVERAVDAGTDDFLTKPINKTELLLRIRALLHSRSQTSDLARTLDYIQAVESNLS